MKKVVSFSWGELEAGGSNIGDSVIFKSQFSDLSGLGVKVGILSAHPEETLKKYPGVKCFDVSRGRLKAILAGLFWADIVVVGGGELVQDQSSRLYSLFNLLPLFIGSLLRKKTFAWAVGIGQGRELTRSTRLLTRLALRSVSGITVRDRGSFNTLHWLGLREPEMKLVSDCALTLRFEPAAKLKMLGAAPRNVSNRQRHFLPLELRKKLGIHKETDPAPAAKAWSRLLDWHSKKYDSDIILFPFHTGSLSNDDHIFCSLVAKNMEMKDRVTIADPAYPEAFLKMLSRCRVMVTTPLHGAILSVAAGTIPVSVSYSSKCTRFMDQAGLGDFTTSDRPGIPDKKTAAALKKAWEQFSSVSSDLEVKREALETRASETAEHFRKTFSL